MSIDMVPIVDTRLAREIEALDPLGAELLDVSIADTETDFRAMNVLRVLDCLDRAASGVRWMTRPNGERAERPIIERLVISPARIPGEAHAFRLDLSPSTLFVSEQLVDLVSTSGISNANFNPVDVQRDQNHQSDRFG